MTGSEQRISASAVKTKQEAQLSQRDRASLRVIDYFVKSLKVIQNDTLKWDIICKSLSY